MKFKFQGLARVEFMLTEEQIDLMMRCSQKHYDATCRAASVQGGIIYSWKRSYEWARENDGTVWPLQATSSDLDLCLKIMEYRVIPSTDEEFAMQRDIFMKFLRAHRRCNELYSHWQDEQEII